MKGGQQFFKQDQSADEIHGFSPSLYIKYEALADFQDNAERHGGIARDDMQKLHNTFTSLIEHELDKVAVFGHAKFEELKECFSDLLNQLQSMVVTPWSNPAAVASALPRVERAVEKSSTLAVQLERYQRENREGFIHICRRFDQKFSGHIEFWVITQMKSPVYCFFQENLSRLLPAMSTCFTLCRRLHELQRNWSRASELLQKRLSTSEGRDCLNAQAQTHHGGDLDEAREHMFKSLQQEILDGNNGEVWTPPESFERKTTKYWVRPSDLFYVKAQILKHVPILIFGESDLEAAKSVSGADASSLLERYRHITSRSDSAHITSIYFDNDKLHYYHERIKRREGNQLFRCRFYGQQPKENDTIFVERKTHHESWSNMKSVKERFDMPCKDVRPFVDGNWDITAFFHCKVKSGALKETKAADQHQMAEETQAMLISTNSKPMVRTSYQRTAFQLPTCNKVRITFDTDLTFVDESKAKTLAGDSWYLPMKADSIALDQPTGKVTTIRIPGTSETTRCYVFPYACLEIKLQQEAPDWLNELLCSKKLTCVYKFSKYLSGCALLHQNKVKMLPHWFQKDGTISMDNGAKKTKDKSIVVKLSHFQPTWNPSKVGLEANDTVTVPEHKGEYDPVTGSANDDMGSAEQKTPDKAPAHVIVPIGNMFKKLAQVVRQRGSPDDESELPFASSSTTQQSQKKTPNRYMPLKVEPKTYFANERTFIQWVSAALLILTMSTALSAFKETSAKMGSVLLMPIAVFFLLYAVCLFHWRANKIRSGHRGPWDDRIGPNIMVLAMTCAAITVGYFEARNFLYPISDSGPSLKESLNCRKHKGKLPGMFATPSDVVFDKNRQRLIVVSRETIFVETEDQAGWEAKISIPNADIEAMLINPDNSSELLVIDEGQNRILTVNMDMWTFGPGPTDLLSDLPVEGFSNGVEGLAFDTRNRIYYMGLETGGVVGYSRDTSLKFQKKIHLKTQWFFGPSKSIVNAAQYKVGALQYVEGHTPAMYVVFDNENTVFEINMSDGILTKKFNMPDHTSVQGISTGWEGFAFLPDRGEVVLVQDSPPDIWILKFDANTGFASC